MIRALTEYKRKKGQCQVKTDRGVIFLYLLIDFSTTTLDGNSSYYRKADEETIMYITPPEIEAYLDSLLPERDDVFLEMEERARREDFPAIGPQMGMLLELLARSMRAKYVIDLGSGYGYSALWLAKALPDDGTVVLTEQDEGKLRDARRFFERMGLLSRADFRQGNAVDIFRREIGLYDLVFNDVDKEDYVEVVKLAPHRLRPGGLLVTDNTLWYGEVTLPDPGETASSILEHNRLLMEHPEFFTVQLPVRDGVSVSLRL
jgi:predicted O-methyltransferase YrrM